MGFPPILILLIEIFLSVGTPHSIEITNLNKNPGLLAMKTEYGQKIEEHKISHIIDFEKLNAEY